MLAESRPQDDHQFNEDREMSEGVLDQILRPLDMSSRPSNYSGYGAERRHLDEDKLIMIWRQTDCICGADRADQFAAMVLALPSLAPTEFLRHFHFLVENDWQWSNDLVVSGNGIDTRDKAGAEWAALSILERVANRVNGAVIDETESIRAEFLAKLESLVEQRDADIAKRRAEMDALIPPSLLSRFR